MAIKLNTFIDIISTEPVKDADGFVSHGDNILATVRAYREEKHASERWANMAAFTTADALFRFRKIPGVTVDATLFIVCNAGRYNIVSVEDVRGKGMYVEAWAERIEGSVM